MGNYFKSITLNDSMLKDTDATSRGKAISLHDMYGKLFDKSLVKDVKMHDANFAFLSTTLAKLHNAPYEPKYFVTWNKDIIPDMGGGFVDYIEYFQVNWAGLMDEFRNVFGNNANYIPRVNASLNQNKVDVYTFEVAYDLRFVELEKMKKLTLQKSIEEIYKNTIVAGWDFFAQKVVYKGIAGKKGLFNSDSRVMVTTIDNTASSGKGFEGMTDDAIVSFFNGVFATYLKESNMNPGLLPDTFLVPTFVGKDLTSRMNELYTNTLRKFIIEHNLGKDEADDENFKVVIASRPDLDEMGVGGHGRIVAYRKAKEFVRVDIPYPMSHFITQPNIERASYTSLFVGQISEIQMPYNLNSTELGVVTYFDFTK